MPRKPAAPSSITKELQRAIDNLSPAEQKQVARSIAGSKVNGSDTPTFDHRWSDKHVKLGVISDTHIGHKMFDERLLHQAFSYFKKEGVEAIYHVGDIVEGMSGRPGHIYELTHIGATAQLDYAAQLLSQAPKPVFAITGNHDHWFKGKNDMGLEVGPTLEHRVKGFKFLGEDEADIKLAPNVTMKLFHPGDGTAYAVSYKLQKLIESLDGGQKPNIIWEAHYHKSLYMFSRNVHAFESGTLMHQSRWMRGKKIAAQVGFWVADIYFDKKGVERILPHFVPGYAPQRSAA